MASGVDNGKQTTKERNEEMEKREDSIRLIPIMLQFDTNNIQWALYFQTGGVEIKEYIEKAGESMLPVHKWHTETFKTRPLTTQEVYKVRARSVFPPSMNCLTRVRVTRLSLIMFDLLVPTWLNRL